MGKPSANWESELFCAKCTLMQFRFTYTQFDSFFFVENHSFVYFTKITFYLFEWKIIAYSKNRNFTTKISFNLWLFQEFPQDALNMICYATLHTQCRGYAILYFKHAVLSIFQRYLRESSYVIDVCGYLSRGGWERLERSIPSSTSDD